MTKCVDTFEMVNPPARGTPVPKFFKPLVRINAMTQDAPANWKLDNCYLDMPKIISAVLDEIPPPALQLVGQELTIVGGNSVTLPDSDNQTLAIEGNQLTISGGNTVTLPDSDNQTLTLDNGMLSISGGNSVTFPGIPVIGFGISPPLALDAAVPTDVVGTDNYLLAQPATWIKFTVGGVDYVVPGYTQGI